MIDQFVPVAGLKQLHRQAVEIENADLSHQVSDHLRGGVEKFT